MRTNLKYCLVKQSTGTHRYYRTLTDVDKHWKAGDALYQLRDGNWYFWTSAGFGKPIKPTWQGALPKRKKKVKSGQR